MSKQVKQMEMDALKQTFQGVKEYVVFSTQKMDSHADHTMRMALRKKKIRVQMVKNSLARRVFKDLGMDFGEGSDFWQGSTWLAWGPESVAELSREFDTAVVRPPLFKDKIKIKGAIAEGQAVAFEAAKIMPTRMEAIGAILGSILSPGATLAGQIIGPAGQIASQIQKLAEKTEEAPAEASPAAAT